MMNLLNKIAHLPSSKGLELRLKDWIKGLGLFILLILSDTLPYLKEIFIDHDYNYRDTIIRTTFVMLAWFVQRYVKNNSAVPKPQEDLPNAP